MAVGREQVGELRADDDERRYLVEVLRHVIGVREQLRHRCARPRRRTRRVLLPERHVQVAELPALRRVAHDDEPHALPVTAGRRPARTVEHATSTSSGIGSGRKKRQVPWSRALRGIMSRRPPAYGSRMGRLATASLVLALLIAGCAAIRVDADASRRPAPADLAGIGSRA